MVQQTMPVLFLFALGSRVAPGFVMRPQNGMTCLGRRTNFFSGFALCAAADNFKRKSSGSRVQNNVHQRKLPPDQGLFLPEPEVIFSNNLLLVVNKPAGYHSQPNESIEQATSKKCILSRLKGSQLGGGSNKDFLLPMHRLDQPCTGVLLFAKNSKAGTRIGNAFRKHQIEKDYFVVVEGDISTMKSKAELVEVNTRRMYRLRGEIVPTKAYSQRGGKSVKFKPVSSTDKAVDGRVCELEWEPVLTLSGNLHLLRVVTSTGAKHQVRAMMAQLNKSPICGDLRYGAKSPLPDASVALHARSLRLPTVNFGEMDMRNTRFIAPLPKSWNKFFNLTDEKIRKSASTSRKPEL